MNAINIISDEFFKRFFRKITKIDLYNIQISINNRPLTKSIIVKVINKIYKKEQKIKKGIWDLKMNKINKKYNKDVFMNIQSINNSNKIAVIVEPRKHKHLSAVLKNVAYYLGKGWSMQIFHGNKNLNYIKKIIGNNTNIILTNLEVDNLTINKYNKLLKSVSFWKKIKADKILIFQTDALLRKNNINDFLKFDYIGGPWPTYNRAYKITKSYIGNGGLSLRTRNVMIKICEKYNSQHDEPEDVYFSKYCVKDKYKIADLKSGLEFSVDVIFNKNPTGMHKAYDVVTIKQLQILLNF